MDILDRTLTLTNNLTTKTKGDKTMNAKDNKETRLIIWTSDYYIDDEMAQAWWDNYLELQEEELTTRDVANELGLDVMELTDEQAHALELLLTPYRRAQRTQDIDMKLWYEQVNDYLDNERHNLCKNIGEEIVCLGDLGRWNGRVLGIKKFGQNIKDILHTENDGVTWYCDDEDVRADMYDHDGSSCYLYRTATDEQLQKIENELYKGKLTREFFIEHTQSLRPHVADVYGW